MKTERCLSLEGTKNTVRPFCAEESVCLFLPQALMGNFKAGTVIKESFVKQTDLGLVLDGNVLVAHEGEGPHQVLQRYNWFNRASIFGIPDAEDVRLRYTAQTDARILFIDMSMMQDLKQKNPQGYAHVLGMIIRDAIMNDGVRSQVLSEQRDRYRTRAERLHANYQSLAEKMRGLARDTLNTLLLRDEQETRANNEALGWFERIAKAIGVSLDVEQTRAARQEIAKQIPPYSPADIERLFNAAWPDPTPHPNFIRRQTLIPPSTSTLATWINDSAAKEPGT